MAWGPCWEAPRIIFLNLWFGILKSSHVLFENKTSFFLSSQRCTALKCQPQLPWKEIWPPRRGWLETWAVSSYHPQFSISEASAFGDTLFPVENFWVRIITFSWAFLLESQRPGCWCGKTFQNKLLLSLGGMPMVSWRRASRIWSWGSGKVALLPVVLPVDSRILEKNKEADRIYSEDNREK